MFYLAINQARPDADFSKIGVVIPAHIKWVNERLADGHLLQAGKWGNGKGIWVLKAESREEAIEFLSDDPILRSGLFDVEINQFLPDAMAVNYS